MFLHTLKPARGSKKSRMRVARGNSSNGGTTAGRGTKGQQARAGKGRRFGFEGGQSPLIRRQPKLGGFLPPRSFTYEVVNLDALEKLPAGSYGIAELKIHQLVRTNSPVKVLGRGGVTKKYALSVHAVSASAKAAIEKAGGTVTLVK
ncbi:50S ribosomal protein L15 [Candidatus Peregrinibacteria bacterium]|nr:50S ribosomal protein L15 [Candidatus Peregrinibacteria bacterium]